MSRLFSLLLVALFAALVVTPALALRGDDVADLASEASNEEVDFLAAEDAADEQAEAAGLSLQAEDTDDEEAEEAAPAAHQSTSASSPVSAAAPAEAVTELKKQVKALAATSKDAFALDAFAAEHDEHTNAASASTAAKSEEGLKIESSSHQTPTGLVVSHSAKVASPTYNPAKHRGQRALRFYCDFKHCHPHGAACFKSCTKLREGQPRIDCHSHCNAVRRKCFNCCARAKLPKKNGTGDDEKTRAERAIEQCNGYTEFCLEYNPPPNVTPDKNWVRSACISIQKK